MLHRVAIAMTGLSGAHGHAAASTLALLDMLRRK
jgi:hypothetical protein